MRCDPNEAYRTGPRSLYGTDVREAYSSDKSGEASQCSGPEAAWVSMPTLEEVAPVVLQAQQYRPSTYCLPSGSEAYIGGGRWAWYFVLPLDL